MQGCSQPHIPGWARVPLSSFFLKFPSYFSYFSSNFPHFGPRGGRLGPWLCHWRSAGYMSFLTLCLLFSWVCPLPQTSWPIRKMGKKKKKKNWSYTHLAKMRCNMHFFFLSFFLSFYFLSILFIENEQCKMQIFLLCFWLTFCFPTFSWWLKKRLGLACKAMRQKWLHIYTYACGYVRQYFFLANAQKCLITYM